MMETVFVVTSRQVWEELVDGEWVHVRDADDTTAVELVSTVRPSMDKLASICIHREDSAMTALKLGNDSTAEATAEIVTDNIYMRESLLTCGSTRVFTSVESDSHVVQ